MKKRETSPDTNLERWQHLFHTLATELQVNIMAHLCQDPVSQICFGLTSSYFYWQVFHEVMDEKDYGDGKEYRHAMDLRLQVSVCGEYSVYGIWEYGFLLDKWDIPWDRSLGELLSEEQWLWGQLGYCAECVKYKPASAFEEFGGEQEMLKGVEERGVEVVADFWWCKRCRVKQLLRDLGEREEVREPEQYAFEERRSLGLKRVEVDDNVKDLLREYEQTLTRSMFWEECEALDGNYETWRSIFSKLGI